jgi:hypothetical protein
VERRRSYVSRFRSIPTDAPLAALHFLGSRWLTRISTHSYNRYLAVAARVVRRSLKDDKRLVAERRGESDLRFAKWQVSLGVNWECGIFGGYWITVTDGLSRIVERQDERPQEPERGQRRCRS